MAKEGIDFANFNANSPVCSITPREIIDFNEIELYHLKDDPDEQNNLAQKNPENTGALAAEFKIG